MIPSYLTKAIHEYIPILEGWCLPERACELADMVMEIKPKTVVSLGVFGARVEIAIGFALRQNANGGMVYGIDPWQKEAAIEGESAENRKWWDENIDLDAIHAGAMRAIWLHRLEPWVTIIRARSEHVYQLFNDIGLLYLDANHTEEASCRDVANYVPRVMSGGYVIADDADWAIPGVNGEIINTTKKALEMIEKDCEFVRQSDNMRVYRKK